MRKRPDISISNKNRMKCLVGQVFNRLTVLELDKNLSKWECMCECGKTLKVAANSLRDGNTKSCGCLQKDLASQRAKARHKLKRIQQGRDPDKPLTSEDHIERLAAAPLMKLIMERDDYTCAWCSDRGVELSVHHIETWAVNKSRRLDRTNLVTLCKPCHKKVHLNDFSVEPDPIMSILLEGYAKIKENPD